MNKCLICKSENVGNDSQRYNLCSTNCYEKFCIQNKIITQECSKCDNLLLPKNPFKLYSVGLKYCKECSTPPKSYHCRDCETDITELKRNGKPSIVFCNKCKIHRMLKTEKPVRLAGFIPEDYFYCKVCELDYCESVAKSEFGFVCVECANFDKYSSEDSFMLMA